MIIAHSISQLCIVTTRFWLGLMCLLAWSPIANATTAAELDRARQWAADYALEQLRCAARPNPTPLLHFFIMMGNIRKHWDENVDSVSWADTCRR